MSNAQQQSTDTTRLQRMKDTLMRCHAYTETLKASVHALESNGSLTQAEVRTLLGWQEDLVEDGIRLRTELRTMKFAPRKVVWSR